MKKLKLILLIITAFSIALPYGIGKELGHSETRECGECHEGGFFTDLPSIEGIPDVYIPNSTYQFTVGVGGGENQSVLAGFQLTATAIRMDIGGGSFIPGNGSKTYPDKDAEGRVIPPYIITHVFPKNISEGKIWKFNWLSPPAGFGQIRFTLYTIAGDNSRCTTGDTVGRIIKISQEKDAPPPKIFLEIKTDKKKARAGDEVKIEVKVSDEGKPVANAKVTLSTNIGNLKPDEGLTDTNGKFTAKFFVPKVQRDTEVNIKAIAEKKDIGANENNAKIIIITDQKTDMSNIFLILLIITIAIVLSVIILFFYMKKKK
ncbi:MAG: choice-of-anchor V domain-containing protein [Candidatus Thermoplasmatota archaeon]